MADIVLLDRAFLFIMETFKRTGHAPHYTDLAVQLECAPREARIIVREVMASGFPGWLHPDTDWIATFPPFSSIPTQYRISVDGEQRWFAQCGFESLAMSLVFPGQRVLVQSLCLDCKNSISIEMKDGEVLSAQPRDIVGHSNQPLAPPLTPETLPGR